MTIVYHTVSVFQIIFYNRWMGILISKHALKHHIIPFYNVVDISSINNFFNVKYDWTNIYHDLSILIHNRKEKFKNKKMHIYLIYHQNIIYIIRICGFIFSMVISKKESWCCNSWLEHPQFNRSTTKNMDLSM